MSSYAAAYYSPAGFPLRRNGTCLQDERSCGSTWVNFHACCPKTTYCPGSDNNLNNNVCCPQDSDCTTPLNENPHCARNETWTMFDKEGYFCCLNGQIGFYNSDYSPVAVGCSDGQPSGSNLHVLLPKEQASAPAHSPSTSSAPASSSSPVSNNHSQSHVGAIAGGVVGGVVGAALIAILVWFLLRRERRKIHQAYAQHHQRQAEGAFQPIVYPEEEERAVPEMDDRRDVTEMESSTTTTSTPVELSAAVYR